LILKDPISGKTLPAVRQKLRDQSLRVLMKSGMITEGFVYLPKVLGGRYVDIRLAQDSFSIERARRQEGNQALEHEYLELRFGFAIPLPDGTFDYELLDTQHTYGDRELPDLSEAEFRSRLESLPFFVSQPQNHQQGFENIS
jgi:hypothetical protein